MIQAMSRGAGSRSAGKKTPILSLAIVFILSLVFPNQSLFAAKPEAPAQAQSTPMPSQAQPLVKVVAAIPQVEVVVPSAAAQPVALFSCSFTTKSGGINLNQPASCFTLEISHFAPNQQTLAVRALPQISPKVVVASWPVKVSSPSLAQAPGAQSIPVLPLTAFAIGIGFLVSDRRVKAKIVNSANNFRQTLNLHQLQVLRC